MRFVAIVDGTIAGAPRQARALGSFLAEGLSGELVGETLILYTDARERGRLVGLAPTRDVRLVRTAARRPERLAALAAAACDATSLGDVALHVCAPGCAGSELAARLAVRRGGALLTDVLRAQAGPERLLCRKSVYSNHLMGRFALRARPWCVSIDASWNDGPAPAPGEHRILGEVEDEAVPAGSAEAAPAPFEDLELTDLPGAGDLAGSRFVVVAGYGAGSRDGVERIALAARRMGAAFGVTRPVAMNAWAPMDRLVGVSGARVAPVVCVVAGASGAAALHWGIEKAAFIVAINLDEQAAIMGNADVAVVDDGVATVEALAEVVAEGK